MAIIESKPLRHNAGVGDEFQRTITALIRRMYKEQREEITRVFREVENPIAMDASPSNQIRLALGRLKSRYDAIFNRVAVDATDRMFTRVLKAVDTQAKSTLKELSEHVTLNPEFQQTAKMREIINASTEESVSLIKLIPERLHADVQSEVMRSITTGQGLKDLIPQLNARYDGNLRHAKLVAMDQTRKAQNNIYAARMQAAGVKEFKWLHVGGSREPRKDHIAMSGKIFRYDDPPVIGKMYGKEVRGLPGQMISCRCQQIAVVNFDD